MCHKLRSLCVGFQREFPAFPFIRPSGGLVNFSLWSAPADLCSPSSSVQPMLSTWVRPGHLAPTCPVASGGLRGWKPGQKLGPPQ